MGMNADCTLLHALDLLGHCSWWQAMRNAQTLVWLVLTGCLPAIPQRALGTRAAIGGALPTLAPCALVHLTVEENLSNGAHGWFRGDWNLVYTTFLIRHPRGLLLVDAAVGNSAAGVDAAPWWFRWSFGSARAAKPLSSLLAEVGVKPEDVTRVLLTHAHWDHAGGLPQLPRARVSMSSVEADWILALAEPLADLGMPHHFAQVRDRVDRLRLQGQPYEGFAASEDVFGDGSIIAVPSPGHSRGATSYFVNSGDGRRWLFVGDTAWVKEGFEEPVMKGRLASWIADWDREQTADALGVLHAIHQARASVVVTSHDERTWQGIERCR